MPRPTAPWDEPNASPEDFSLSPPDGSRQEPVTFIAYGNPIPKGSAKGFAVPMKRDGEPVVDDAGQRKYRAVVTHDNPNTKEWERTVRTAAQHGRGSGRFFRTEPVEIRICFGLSRPASVSTKKRPLPTVRPDLDKLVRAIQDAVSGVIYADDAQVVSIRAWKKYVESGPPYAQVWIGDAE